MSRKVEKHLKLTYPSGCKEINEELSNDELVKRLKLLTRAFQDMVQEENDEFKELAIYLASEYFLEHNNKDVKLLVACCIADIFRVFVPDAPYTEPEQLKEIFLFLIDQLKGLKDPDSPLFKRYFYLLENLAWVKSFNISLELPDNSEILFRLFKTTFELINERHNNKVSVMMLDILCPLVSEADSIPQEVLDIFLACIIEPFKTQNRPAYEMARDLIKRTSSVLEPYIELFLSNCLIQSHKSEKSSLSTRVYDLIQELNHISTSLLQNVLPQLEFRLKSSDDTERMAATRLLTKMFAAPNSDLALQHKQLWNAFLGRFNDIDLNIRRMTVQSCQDIIINHAELVTEEAAGSGVAEHLKHRQHDSDENVRMDVVKVIVGSAKVELKHVPDDLLECVKERTLDKKFKVRREALVGLGQIYKKCHEVGGDVMRVAWIRNKVLHAYYQVSIDDKILVERILNTSLVPYSMDPPSRMKQLYLLYSNLDEHATRALQEIFKTQSGLRNIVKNILDLQQKVDSQEVGQAINTKILALSRHLPEPEKACQQLQKFFKSIQESKTRLSLQNLISPQCGCKKAEEYVKEIIKKLGNSTPQNLLYATVKQLLERVAPLMIDNLSILALITLIQQVIQSKEGDQDDEEEDDDEGKGGRREERLNQMSGLKLLLLLSQNFSGSFQMNDIYDYLLKFIKYDDDAVVDMTMQILRNVGAGIDQTFPEVHSSLLPVLQKMIKIGTTKQAKHAIRCIDILCKDKADIFNQLFEQLQLCMTLDSSNLLTSIVAIGHLCQLCPNKFVEPTGNIISKFIMQEVLMQDRTVGRKTTDDWCEEKYISEETLIKLESLKMIGRWMLGLRDQNNTKVSSIMRMLYTMILCEGDLMERGHINKPEMSRLRLQAGCCMLKLAQEPVYADVIKMEQFETMALLINDPCLEVRQQFVSKLHKGLMNLRLPIQYMGIMCLGALDPMKERRALVKQMLSANINRRREYIRQNPSCATSCTVYSILPDYVLPYSVHLLAHDPDFTSYDNVTALRSIKDCLLFLIDPLLFKNDTVSFNFYSKMLENIKNTADAQCPESEEANKKLYATCDLAMSLLLTKMTSFTIKNFPAEPVLPTKLFKPLPSNKINSSLYLSTDVLNQLNKNRGKQGSSMKTDNPHRGKDDMSTSSSPPPSPVSSNKSSSLRNNTGKESTKASSKMPTKPNESSTTTRNTNISDDAGDNDKEDEEEQILSTRSRSSDASQSNATKKSTSTNQKAPSNASRNSSKTSDQTERRGTRSTAASAQKRKLPREDEDDDDDVKEDDDEEEEDDGGAVEDDDDDDDDVDKDEEEDNKSSKIIKSQEVKKPQAKKKKLNDDDDDDDDEQEEDDEKEDVKVVNKKTRTTKKSNKSQKSSKNSKKKISNDGDDEEKVEDDDDEEEDENQKYEINRNSKNKNVHSKKKLADMEENDDDDDADDDDEKKDDEKKDDEKKEEENGGGKQVTTRKRKQTSTQESTSSSSSSSTSSKRPAPSLTNGLKNRNKQGTTTNNKHSKTNTGTTKKTTVMTRREGAAAKVAKKYQDFEVTLKSPNKKK